MWIVQLALRRPYTFVVMALLILLLGAGAIYTTPTDCSGTALALISWSHPEQPACRS
jgi:hypothetical protein